MSNIPEDDIPKAPPARRRSIVYIDGYNFYYNAIKRSRYRWLNIEKFIKSIRNNDDIQRIYYFTALSLGRSSQNKQMAYWKALSTLPLLSIVKGRHKKKDRQCFVGACTHAGDRLYESVEEKRTDVNIAVQMVDDAYQDACDVLVLISGDSDLVPAINLVRSRFPEKQVVVYVPTNPGPCGDDDARGGHNEIREAAHKASDLPLKTLQHAQFPPRVPLPGGETAIKPGEW